MKTQLELERYVQLLGGIIDFGDSCLTVKMPPIKTQPDGDFICYPATNSLNDNIQAAYDWLKNWEEYWSLKSRIKKDDIKVYLKKQLSTNHKWIYKSILLIFKFQTATEQQSERTIIRNNVGFNGRDAELMSSFAKQIQAGRTFSEKQMNVAKKVMPRYWKQVQDASNEHKLLKLVAAANPTQQTSLRFS